MKVVIVQIYRFHPEIAMLRRMACEFLKRGFRMVLWTNVEQDSAGIPTIPLVWQDETESLFNFALSKESRWQEVDIWKNYVSSLESIYERKLPQYSVDRWHHVSSLIFDVLHPSLFLCWAGLEPCYAIPRKIAKQRGIPTLIWEAGMLPLTFYLNIDGICGESDWIGKSLPNLDKKSIEYANNYLLDWHSNLLDKNNEKPKRPGQDLRILIIGGMDVANGVRHPYQNPSLTLPGYEDGIDLAIKVSKSHQGITIYRPHPNESKAPLKRLESTLIKLDQESSLIQALLDADVVIGYGSKVDFVAMALGKPFIMAGVGLITGKNCAYVALYPEDLPSAILAAARDQDSALHADNFKKLVAFILSQGHYNRGQDGPCRLGISDLVTYALTFSDSKALGGNFYDVLSDEGKRWWEKSISDYRYTQKCKISINPISDVRDSLEILDENSRIILDFDHTLWLGNSTEQFIGSVRPRIWGEILERFSKSFWRLNQYRLPWEMDQFRVLIITLLAPWTWTLWKWKSGDAVKKYWTEELFEATQVKTKNSPIIISFGFNPVITPLINAWSKSNPDHESPKLLASGFFHKEKSLRYLGKVTAIEKAFPDLEWFKSLVVSDSLEDRDLLVKARRGVLAQWAEPKCSPRLGYFPFRYIVKGKYPGTKYFSGSILGRDLIVWMILFSTDYFDIIPSLLFFLSFQMIYEVGYYENDFLAAKSESKPSLSDSYLRFSDYHISPSAWVWATSSAAIGCFLMQNGFTWQNLGIWTIFLIVLRISFHIYNRQTPEKRLLYYLLLQSLKNFGGLLVLAPTTVGLILGISHFFQHSTTYMIYRCGGDKSLFPRDLIRMCLFLIGLVIAIFAGFDVLQLNLGIGLVFVIYYSLTERFGYQYSLTSILKIHFLPLPLRVARRVKKIFTN